MSPQAHRGAARRPAEPKTPPYPQTTASAVTWLRARGIGVAELARTFNVPRMAFVDLLRGKAKGHRGSTHRAAVILGLKPNPDSDSAAG